MQPIRKKYTLFRLQSIVKQWTLEISKKYTYNYLNTITIVDQHKMKHEHIRLPAVEIFKYLRSLSVI